MMALNPWQPPGCVARRLSVLGPQLQAQSPCQNQPRQGSLLPQLPSRGKAEAHLRGWPRAREARVRWGAGALAADVLQAEAEAL